MPQFQAKIVRHYSNYHFVTIDAPDATSALLRANDHALREQAPAIPYMKFERCELASLLGEDLKPVQAH